MNDVGAPRTRLLLGFGRLTAEAAGADALLPLLAEACVDPAGVGASAAVVLRVEPDGRVAVATARGVPPAVQAFSQELETIDGELGLQLRTAWGETTRAVTTYPLVSGRDIYGALVIFSAEGGTIDRDQGELAEGLADLVAVALDKAARYASLAKSYADLRASREALAKSEKLRALGEMAAGISHDLKNILNPLGLQLDLLRRRIAKDPAAALVVVSNMEEALRSGVDVVERLRAFSRQAPEAEAEPVDLNGAVTTALELCRPRITPGASLELRSEPGEPPAVLARRSELITAVVNLVFNAIDALGGSGQIVLRTGAEAGGGWIEVSDTGPGMPEEVEKRVFEPFFTTKAQGTGLGLAMVYAFVQRHHGKVSLWTKPGEGTRFRLWFPASTAG
jgi:two-component system, NtrC family, sensor histidine kinase HydH